MDVTVKTFLFCIEVLSSQYVGAHLLNFDECWRPEDSCNSDTSIKPFEIRFEEDMITDLKYRLDHTRKVTPPLHGTAFEYGFNTDSLQSWLTYWSVNYLPNIKERQKYLNQFNHYKTRIQCLNIHFIRYTPEVPSNVTVLPLLILHGFPSTVRELYKVIPLLGDVSEDRDYALEIIAPSLPGFGYSDPATIPGMGSSQIAVVFRNFMLRLGYEKFLIQGGDWGSIIGTDMCTLFPESVLGFHTTYARALSPIALGMWAVGSLKPSAVVDDSVQNRMYPLLSILEGLLRESGYLHIQATKPDTIGVALGDSPAGLLAYFLQVFSTATRKANVYKKDGGLLEYYTREELLDNLMIYWATNSVTTACRIYAETYNKQNMNLGVYKIPTDVPMWSLHSSDELIYQSPFILQFKYTNHLHATVLYTGGHFLALEMPEQLAEDVHNAVAAILAFRQEEYCLPY